MYKYMAWDIVPVCQREDVTTTLVWLYLMDSVGSGFRNTRIISSPGFTSCYNLNHRRKSLCDALHFVAQQAISMRSWLVKYFR
ncbi:hypothetical protein J6590_047551 [Homalodisca vitripennis]|nr:hypothetical protein J6590_047551 [Homalodisca vitripennis]